VFPARYELNSYIVFRKRLVSKRLRRYFLSKRLRRYFLYNRFQRGRVSNKRWSADHGLLVTDTLVSLVDTLALITRLISFPKGGLVVATGNVSKFGRDILCLCSKQRVAKCGCRLVEASQKVTPAPHEWHRNKNVS
jgi:hypothetical protein